MRKQVASHFITECTVHWLHGSKNKMTVLNRLLSLLFIFISLIASATAANVSVANTYCQETCGNVTIPYPFGIGDSHCYLAPYYEITCNGSTPRPFLRKLNLEVLDVTLEGGLSLNNPIYSTCKYGSSWNSSDSRGTPFAFSITNRFLTVGCENALMMNQRNNVLAGCTSTCRQASPRSKGCYGINCCQTTIPDYLQFYRLVSTVNKNKSACTYAFLADDSLLTSSSSNLSMTMNQDYAPVEFIWTMQSRDFPRGNEFDSSHSCYVTSTVDCSCRLYYEGNPYIVNGCQIVPECANCKESCDGNESRGFYCMPNQRSKTTEIIIAGTIGGVAGILILILFCFGIYKIIKRRRELKQKKNFFKRNGGFLLEQQLSATENSYDTNKIFTVRELEKATDNFNISRVLGQGGQGTVYKGMLIDGKIVAVKKSKLVDEGQVEQFINEVVILSQINHRNIVKLLGCCLETDVPLLVYEFISNGTLSQLIRNQDDKFPLSWEMRLQIATEVSGALAYLHSATSVPIYHRDIKSCNILLDDKFRAKIADFGTSRSVAIDQTHMTTIVQGTFGYLDPEFFQSSQFTDKSDVYSFGVVLAELLTGERPVMSRAGQNERSLATYFISAIEEDFLFKIIDERVANEGSKDEVTSLALLARRCLNLNGRHRPTMKEVMFAIERIRASRMPSSVSVSNKFHNVQSIIKYNTNQENDNDLCSTSFSDYPQSVSDDSYPLMYTGE